MEINEVLRTENCLLFLLLALDLVFLFQPGFLGSVFSFLFILFVPGFLVLGLLRREMGLQEALALSAALGVGLGVVLFEVLGLLFPMDSLSVLVAYNVLVVSGFLLSVRRRGLARVRLPERRTIFLVSHLLVLSLPVFLAFNPYISLVSDGWKHVSIVNQMESLEIPPSDPRLAGYELVYPWGSHLFMGLAKAISGAPGLEIYNIFTWLSVFVLFLGSTYLARRFLGEREALLAGLITTSMAGLSWILLGLDLLGPGSVGTGELIRFLLTYSFSFLVTSPFAPLTLLGMGMMAVAIRVFLEFIQEGGPERLATGSLITGSLLIIEVIPAGTVALVLAIPLLYSLARSGFSPGSVLPYLKIGLSMVPFYLLFALVYRSGSSASPSLSVVLRHGPAELLLMYGLPLVLAAYGAWLALRERDRGLGFMAVLLVLFLALFNFVDYGSLPVDYRFMFYILIPIGILGSRGLSNLAGRLGGLRKGLLVFLVLSVAFIPVFMGAFVMSLATREISEGTRQAAGWISENSPRDSVVLTGPYSYHTYGSAFGERSVYLGAFSSVNAYSNFFGESSEAAERLDKVHRIFNTTGGFLDVMDEEGIDYVLLGYHEFLAFDEPQLTKFLDGLVPVFSGTDSLVLARTGQAIDLGDTPSGFISGKIQEAERTRTRIEEREASIRAYVGNPTGLLGALIIGLLYYYSLLVLISREVVRNEG